MSQLTAGMKITVIRSNAMAMTVRDEIQLKTVTEGEIGTKKGLGTYTEKGKRKAYQLCIDSETIIMEGWDLPVRVDSDGGLYIRGNGLINFTGDPDVVREHVDKAMFATDAAKSVAICHTKDDSDDDKDTVILYPQFNSRHACMQQIRDKQ